MCPPELILECLYFLLELPNLLLALAHSLLQPTTSCSRYHKHTFIDRPLQCSLDHISASKAPTTRSLATHPQVPLQALADPVIIPQPLLFRPLEAADGPPHTQGRAEHTHTNHSLALHHGEVEDAQLARPTRPRDARAPGGAPTHTEQHALRGALQPRGGPAELLAARVERLEERGAVEGEGRRGGELREAVLEDGGMEGGGGREGSGEGAGGVCEGALEVGEATGVEDELVGC